MIWLSENRVPPMFPVLSHLFFDIDMAMWRAYPIFRHTLLGRHSWHSYGTWPIYRWCQMICGLKIVIFHSYMAMDQYLLIPFLGGWTSIYQLFWCSPGVQGFDTLPYRLPECKWQELGNEAEKNATRRISWRNTGLSQWSQIAKEKQGPLPLVILLISGVENLAFRLNSSELIKWLLMFSTVSPAGAQRWWCIRWRNGSPKDREARSIGDCGCRGSQRSSNVASQNCSNSSSSTSSTRSTKTCTSRSAIKSTSDSNSTSDSTSTSSTSTSNSTSDSTSTRCTRCTRCTRGRCGCCDCCCGCTCDHCTGSSCSSCACCSAASTSSAGILVMLWFGGWFQ